MRCRRLCERKPSGKFNISEDVSQQYKDAGEGREALEMALLECLAKWGTSRCSYKKVKARHVLKLIKSTNGERDTDTSWIMIVYAWYMQLNRNQETLPFYHGYLSPITFLGPAVGLRHEDQTHSWATGESGIRDVGKMDDPWSLKEEWQVLIKWDQEHQELLWKISRVSVQAPLGVGLPIYPKKYPHVLYIHACLSISRIACSYSHVAGLGDTMTKWASTMSSLKIAPCTRSLTPHVKLRRPSAPKLGIWIMFAWWDLYIRYMQTRSLLPLVQYCNFHSKQKEPQPCIRIYMTCSWKNHPY